MKQKEANKSVTFGALEGFNTVIAADGSGFLVALLRDKLYNDKRKVALFETLANAVDANRQIGATKNVEIVLTRTNLVIRDHGPGCDRDKMQNVYFAYCNSSKSDSNKDIGGFGIGSKSPSAYSDAYFVTSNNGGMSTMYMSVINGNTNKVSITSSIPLDDADDTGLTVKIPINDVGSLTEELSVFNSLAIDGLVFRATTFGSDCIDYFDARNLDDDLEDWDARTDDERASRKFSFMKEMIGDGCGSDINAGNRPSHKYASIAAIVELVDKCPYFASMRGLPGCPDEKVMLYADKEPRDITYGQLSDIIERIGKRLDGFDGSPAAVASLKDDDMPAAWIDITRKYRFDYIPGAGFVFVYDVQSPFYRSQTISNSMVLACDGDMSYGIPGELTGKYSRYGLLGRDRVAGGYVTFLAEFSRDELTIQPNREMVASDQLLESWLESRCTRFENYYIMKCGVLALGTHLGTDCLLSACARRADDFSDGEFIPCSDYLARDIRDMVKKNGASSAYDKPVDLSKCVKRLLMPRKAMYNENGKFVLADVPDTDSVLKSFSVKDMDVIAVVNDSPDVKLDAFKLLHKDLSTYLEQDSGGSAAKYPALQVFCNNLCRAGESTNPSSFKVRVLLLDAADMPEFDKITSVYRRDVGVSGFLKDVDKFFVSDILKFRNDLGYYDSIVNVSIKEVKTFSHKYNQYLNRKVEEAVVEAAELTASGQPVPEDSLAVTAPSQKKRKRKATGSSTLTASKPICRIKMNGVRSVNGKPETVDEFKAGAAAVASACSSPCAGGVVDWSGWTDTVMVQAGLRYKNTDVITNVLLRSDGDSSDSMCCGNMVRAMLGIRNVVRVLPSEAERLASENGWKMWYDVDYVGRMQHVLDSANMTFIPSRLLGIVDRLGMKWTPDASQKIKTVSANGCFGHRVFVDIGHNRGEVSVGRLFSCMLYVLSCMWEDPYYNTYCRKVNHAVASVSRLGPVGGLQDSLQELEAECVGNLRSLDEKSSSALSACAESVGIGRDPGLIGILPVTGDTQQSSVDAKLAKGYNVLVKALAPFNKPLDLYGILGAVGPCEADASGKIKLPKSNS